MAKTLGRKVSVGVGKEGTRGTYTAPTHWLPWTSLKADEKIEVAKVDAAYGTIHKSTDGQVVKQWSEVEITGPICDKAIGLILYSLFGTLNSAAQSAPNAAAYDHTFTVAETVAHQSLSIGVDNAIQDYSYSLGVLNTFGIKYEVGKILEYTASFIAKKGATQTLTPAFATNEYVFRPADFTFKIADAVSGLAAASPVILRAMELNFKKNAQSDFSLGSAEPVDNYNTTFEVDGSFTVVYDAVTYETLALAGTKKAISVALSNAGVTIATSAHPGLAFTLAQIQLEDLPRDIAIDDLVLSTYKFTGQYKLSETKAVSAVLTNLTTTY